MTEYLFRTFLTKLHYSFTSLSSLVIQETADKGTLYSGCCLLQLTIFQPKWEPTVANHHCLSLNNNQWHDNVSFGVQISIVFGNYHFHAIISTTIYAEKTFVNLLAS